MDISEAKEYYIKSIHEELSYFKAYAPYQSYLDLKKLLDDMGLNNLALVELKETYELLKTNRDDFNKKRDEELTKKPKAKLILDVTKILDHILFGMILVILISFISLLLFAY